MLYEMLKKIINAKTYTKTDAIKRVNTFFAFDQLTEAEYTELMGKIETAYTA